MVVIQIDHFQDRAKWQADMCSGQIILVIALTVGGELALQVVTEVRSDTA